MKNYNFFALILLILVVAAPAAFGQRAAANSGNANDLTARGARRELKILAQGSQSPVDSSFIFIARDAETYRLLQNLVTGLPAVENIDFTKNAVIAGFGGTRPTGGWSVEIRQAGRKVMIDVKGPRKDMMVTQVITTPFKVAQVAVEDNRWLPVEFAGDFAKQLSTFSVDRADFEYSGGIAGRRTQFSAGGTIKVMRFGDYVTVSVDLQGNAKANKSRLIDIASGRLTNGRLSLVRLDAGSFVQLPRPAFQVNGTLQNELLTLNFESRTTPYADGYTGRGTLSAKPLQ